MQTLRTAALSGELKEDDKLDIQLDRPLQEGQQVIISNEGFSTAFLNGGEAAAEAIPAYIELVSSVLGNMLSDLDKALMVVREPISWIQSMHAQSIKEGASDSAQVFVDKNKAFLAHSLNIAHIAECYSRSFPRFNVVPFELLSENEAGYWALLEKLCGIRRPVESSVVRNPSPGRDDLYLLARLNGHDQLLMEALRKAPRYPVKEERESLLKTFGGSSPWVNRRVVECASEDRKAELRVSMNLDEVPKDFFEFHLDGELRQSIRERFVGALQQMEAFDQRFVDEYFSKLEADRAVS